MKNKIVIVSNCILLSLFFIFVANNASASTVSSRDIFIESQTNNSSPTLQSQVIYTVRLYFRTPMQDAALLDPHTDNVLTYRIGNGSVYDTVHQGTPYRVLVQRYGLFPQVSGSIVINSARFIGHSIWDGAPVRIDGPSLTLHVQPIPNKLSKTEWLPANKISLQEVWSPSPPVFHPGGPITRVITLQATAVPETRLPNLPNSSFVSPTQNIKVYFDPPQSSMDSSQNEVVSKRVWKITYLPVTPNTSSTTTIFTVPKIDIPWWNNQTKRVENVGLPSRNISNVTLPSRNTSFDTDVINTRNVINAQNHSQTNVPILFNAKISRVNSNSNNPISFYQNPAENTNLKTTNDNEKIGIALAILMKRLAGKLLLVLFIIMAIGYGTSYINRRRTSPKTQTSALNSVMSFNKDYNHLNNTCDNFNNIHKQKKKSNRSLLPELYPDP
jgi:hypothetical protein